MTAIIRRSAVAMIAMAMIALGTFLCTDTVSAQCGNVTVFNNTGAAVNLCLFDAFGVVVCNTVPPGGPSGPFALPPGFIPLGAVDAAGTMFPFNPPPPCTGCTPSILLTAPATMGYVCYDPVCCIAWIFP